MKEKVLNNKKNGMLVLILTTLLYLLSIAVCVVGAMIGNPLLLGISIFWMCVGWFPYCGLRVLKPQEALVLTLFGKYTGTLKGEGFYAVNPFCTSVNPAADTHLNQSGDVDNSTRKSSLSGLLAGTSEKSGLESAGKKISLKIMTLNNSRQKINDCLGNPVEIGIAVMWRVVDTSKAVFNVDNYKEYLSLQCDTALRNIVRVYPYDVSPNVDTTGDGVADEGSLRGSSEVVAARIRDEIQKRVSEAGLEILEARITYLAYAPEIAAVMLQRQQASAIIDARKMIVDGAVGMVEMALDRLSEKKVVELDEERKACNGFKSSCRLVRQQRCAAYCKFGKFVLIMADQKKKQIPLRLSAKLYDAVAAWAEDDFRSVNGQIEYLLTECVRQRKKNGKYVSEHLDEHPEFDIK